MMLTSVLGWLFKISTSASSLASSSSESIFPYSSTLTELISLSTKTVQDADLGHDGSTPSICTVAVTQCRSWSEVSTIMVDVPWPWLILPSDTSHLKDSFVSAVTPVTLAWNATCPPENM